MRALIGLLLLITSSALALEWGAGMALQGRVQNEVNPDFYEARALGQLFARVRQASWSGLLEVGEEQRKTSSGYFGVNTRSRSLGAWGRFEPWPGYGWSPFLGMGTGLYMDKVETHLRYEVVEKSGRRLFLGAAAGISRTLWEQCLVEIEARVQSVEQNVDPVYSGILRIGYVF